MSETKHTPGPWDWDRGDIGADQSVLYCVVTAENGDLTIADVNFHSAANARLIAAAPDLLEACASVWLLLSDTGDNELRLIADECRAAIAKATGR